MPMPPPLPPPSPPENTGIVPPHLRKDNPPFASEPPVRKDVVQRIARYAPLLHKAAARTGLGAEELAGTIAAESEGKADSGKGTPGYKGLFQAKRTDDQLNPEISIFAGATKLKTFRETVLGMLSKAGLSVDSMDRWEVFRLVLRGYNAGPAVVATALGYAREAGDAGRWMEEEHYARALLHHGSYSTRHYSPKATQATLASAEKWRQKLKQRNLSLRQAQDELSKESEELRNTVMRAVVEKARRTPAYTDKAVAYARYFANHGFTSEG